MLRIAVPNKGSLSDPAGLMLTEAGYRQRTDPRELVLSDPDNDTALRDVYGSANNAYGPGVVLPQGFALMWTGNSDRHLLQTGFDIVVDEIAEALAAIGVGAATPRLCAAEQSKTHPSPPLGNQFYQICLGPRRRWRVRAPSQVNRLRLAETWPKPVK